jgi:hypothetical protein
MKKREIFILILIGPLLLAGLAALPCFVVAYPFIFAYGQRLKFRFRQHDGKQGRFVLLVYSDSPNLSASFIGGHQL